MTKALLDIDPTKAVLVPTLFIALCASAWGQAANSSPANINDDENESTASPSAADDDAQGPSKQGKVASKIPKPKKEKRGSIIIAPIPISSPAIGSGLVLVAGYVFKVNQNDKLSPPSAVGGVAAFTNNGSRGGGVGGRLYFKENKYQTTFAVGAGRINYDFYGIGRRPGIPTVFVPIHQSGKFFYGEFLRNFGKHVFIGGGFQHRNLTASINGTARPGGFEIPQIDLKSITAAIIAHVQQDLRNSTFYPTKGTLFNLVGNFFDQAWGSKREYQTYKLSYSGYRELAKKQVFAYQGFACSANGSVPFYDLCFYGSNNELRGYTAGQFQNRRMFGGQAEYRLELPKRFGAVVFGGVGGVARTWSDFRSDMLLPAAGAGIRFNLDKKNHINYRIDWAIGRAGHTLTIGVGEAF
jgi:hypothetical protein